MKQVYKPEMGKWLLSEDRLHSDGIMYNAGEYVDDVDGRPNPAAISQARENITQAHKQRAKFIKDNGTLH